MPNTVSRELALQEHLRTHVPQVDGQLDAPDVLILRAVWQQRRHPARRLPASLSALTGIDRGQVEERLTRLTREGWLQRLHGYALTRRARALHTLLWVCTTCGCTDEHACQPNSCYWIREDLCSRCVKPDLDYALRLRMRPPIRFPYRRRGGLA